MQTKAKLGEIKERIILHRLLGVSCASLAVFILTFVLIPTLISKASATTASGNVRWGEVDLELDPDVAATSSAVDPAAEKLLPTHGNINFGDITPGSRDTASGIYGSMIVQKKTIGVTTRGTYYTVYVSMSSSNQDLNFTYNNTVNTNMHITASTGTWLTPATLPASATTNGSTWGYMVPEVGPFSSLTQEDATTLFDGKLGVHLTPTNAETIYNTTTWAAVPALSAPQQIWKNIDNEGFSSGDTFDIYYGVVVDTNTMAGTYQNSIVYTALASASSLDAVSYNIAPSINFGGENTEVTLTFDLTESSSGLIDEDDITIRLVPRGDMVAASYDIANLDEEDVDDYLVCAKVADSLSISTFAEITCTIPDNSINGSRIIVDNTTNNLGYKTGEYEFWLNVAGFDYNYVSQLENGTKAGFAYVGLQSTDSEGKNYVKYMQDIERNICQNTNMWGTGTGDNARIYDYLGEQKTTVVDPETSEETIVYNGTLLANTAVDSVTISLGTYDLIDNRDQKDYLVRRLADGYCWMVQNLDLDLASFAGTHNLTKENTSISADYWDPRETAYQIAETVVGAEGYDGPALTEDNYFEITSLNRVGMSQHYQFQPTGVTGDKWGSMLDESGEPVETMQNNSRAVIPRSYDDGLAYVDGIGMNQATSSTIDEMRQSTTLHSDNLTFRGTRYGGDFYNWYAATAGQGGYSNANPLSSICPKKWQLPNVSTVPAWSTLVAAYLEGESEKVKNQQTRLVPISISKTGAYYDTGYHSNIGEYAYGWTRVSSSSGKVYTLHLGGSSGFSPNYSDVKTRGLNIRCVAG